LICASRWRRKKSWILTQLNPLKDAVDVEEALRDHPNPKAVQIALAQCGAFRQFMDSGGGTKYESPIGKSGPPATALANVNFVGCMPVNFSRHNLEEIQRAPDSAYYLSEKTDGVRHFMVFTGDTVVLVDRAMRGKQPIPLSGGDSDEPIAPILDLIQPGTVLDGEVVMKRRVGRNRDQRSFGIQFNFPQILQVTVILWPYFSINFYLDYITYLFFRYVCQRST
jgi:hypothetical protein